MGKELTGTKALERIRELIKDIDIGMLSTQGLDDKLRSRPMSSNKDVDTDGTIYFFASEDSRLVDEIRNQPNVQVSFSKPDNHTYVSVCGTASVSVSKSELERHWKPQLKAWFPAGVDEPGICLIKVKMTEAEYWESRGSFISHTLSFASALISGETPDLGDHGVVR